MTGLLPGIWWVAAGPCRGLHLYFQSSVYVCYSQAFTPAACCLSVKRGLTTTCVHDCYIEMQNFFVVHFGAAAQQTDCAMLWQYVEVLWCTTWLSAMHRLKVKCQNSILRCHMDMHIQWLGLHAFQTVLLRMQSALWPSCMRR